MQSVSLEVLGLGGQEDGDFCILGIKILGYQHLVISRIFYLPRTALPVCGFYNSCLPGCRMLGLTAWGGWLCPVGFSGFLWKLTACFLFLCSRRGCHSHPLGQYSQKGWSPWTSSVNNAAPFIIKALLQTFSLCVCLLRRAQKLSSFSLMTATTEVLCVLERTPEKLLKALKLQLPQLLC